VNWFIGVITNESARTVAIPLDFLPSGSGRRWTLRTYSDKLSDTGKPDPTIQRGVSRIAVTNMSVQRGRTLSVPLAPAGGAALWLAPAE
jgi:alpha-glucosidase